jgi:hypothetical protein
LVVAHRRKEERQDRRAALNAWVTVEMNRDSQKRPEPFRLEELVDWLGHGVQPHHREPPQTEPETPDTEVLMQKALTFMQLFGEQKAQASGSVPAEGEP